MIKKQKLKEARLEKGLSQDQVGELTKQRFGVGSQQGYAKIESGRAPTSRYLAYYCTILGLEVSEVDDGLSSGIDAAVEVEMNKLLKLPEGERIKIAQQLLASLEG